MGCRKRYDQSVTCLADDPGNLAIRSNKRHTPGTLSQTNNTYISNQARVHEIKLKIRDLTRKFNLRTPVCKKNQIKRSNETQTTKKTRSVYQSRPRLNFTAAKACLSWLNGKRVSRWRSRRLNRLIPINKRKVKQKRRFDQKSKSEIIAEKSDEKEKRTNG